jgi:hypothetical protein
MCLINAAGLTPKRASRKKQRMSDSGGFHPLRDYPQEQQLPRHFGRNEYAAKLLWVPVRAACRVWFRNAGSQNIVAVKVGFTVRSGFVTLA